MNRLPACIPRATDLEALGRDPLAFLAEARSRLGDRIVLRDGGSVFARDPDCAGAVAVFGRDHTRTVLSDIEAFGMPLSAAKSLGLPDRLVNLNRGLHSMSGPAHAEHQRLLLRALTDKAVGERMQEGLHASLEDFFERWKPGMEIRLLSEMRELTLLVSTNLLFGGEYPERMELARCLREYFHRRREGVSPLAELNGRSKDELIELGRDVDKKLRHHVRWCRRQAHSASPGLLPLLARLSTAGGNLLSDDELVGHANVVFISTNEPIAVAVTWILLILSQLPELRLELGQEQATTTERSEPRFARDPERPPLLDCVVRESLRVLTPNALMARVTRRPALLGNAMLPERSEIVLCPFLAHRDPDVFDRPTEFLPSRWPGLKPSPFDYFPFGGGGRACPGRELASHAIRTVTACLLKRYDLVLARDQSIDWRIHILFMPRDEPVMKIRKRGAVLGSAKGGKLLGPVGELLCFTPRAP